MLRLEDTDRVRSKDRARKISILDAMEWLGLDWDEGPFYQTQRFERYRQVIDRMVEQGRAYWCHCTPEEVEQKREAARAKGQETHVRRQPAGKRAWARLRARWCASRAPVCGQTSFLDLVKGPISFENSELDDLVILKSDGAPTYHLAVVVDDVDMAITHVIRGDDHVNNTPRQILLYQAMDAPTPAFAHVPMILGPDKTRLEQTPRRHQRDGLPGTWAICPRPCSTCWPGWAGPTAIRRSFRQE